MSAPQPGQTLRVLYDFRAEEDGEMTVATGTLLTIIDSSNAERDGWVLAETHDGRRGFVPADYIGPAPAAPPPPAASAPTPAPTAPAAPAPATAARHTDSLFPDPIQRTPAAPAYTPSASLALAALPPAPAPAPAEEYAQVFASHEEWFKQASAKRQEVYRVLQSEAMDILRAMAEAESRSNSMLGRVSELEALISEERAKWQTRLQEDAAAAVGALQHPAQVLPPQAQAQQQRSLAAGPGGAAAGSRR